MLPRANKFFKPSIYLDTKSNQLTLSKDRIDLNKSAQLSQTKKINLNQFSLLNVDKKRSAVMNTAFKRRGKFFT
jgi:hypothetical protein